MAHPKTEFKKGRTPWNKGLHIYTGGGAKKGHIPWNKGKKLNYPVWNKGKKGTYSLKHSGQFNKGHIPWIKGKHHYPETIAKFKKSLIGRKVWNKGTHIQTNNALEKWVKANGAWNKNKKYPQITGAKHPLWKGGITSINEKIRKSLEYKQWTRSIFKRDNWTCQKCFKVGKKLHSHHKKSFSEYPKLRLDIKNGITLCKICHLKIHSKPI